MKKIVILSSVFLAAAALIGFATEEQHHVMSPSDLKWGEVPPGLPSGGKMAVLNGDPTKAGPFTVRMQAPAGYKIQPHTHPTSERITVISGTFRVGMGDKFDQATMEEMSAGSYVVLPSGMAHFASTDSDSVIQIDSEGPFQIKYANPADDPRNAKK